VTAFDEIDYYTDPSLLEDPYPYYDYLRSICPVAPLPHRGVLAVTGYDESAEVLRDAETFSSCAAVTGPIPGFRSVPQEGETMSEFIDAHRDELPMHEYMLTQDPPHHHEHRSLVLRLFTPKRMLENEAFMRRLAEELMDPLIEARRFELLHQYGQPFALTTIADLLGVPEEDHREFRRQLGVEKPAASVGGDDAPISFDPLAFLNETFTNYIEDRRANPRDDVLTTVALGKDAEGNAPDIGIMVRLATFLFAAGQDTTARLMATATQLIADHPGVQEYLREDLGRIPNFIEETLRYESVVKSKARFARHDAVIGGVEIPAGTMVALFPGATNRDPRHFDEPNEFRPDRSNASDHLSFGRGIHSCPGAPLARIEARVTLERLLSRTSHIGLDEEHHGPPGDRRFKWDPTFVLRGTRSLHLVVEPAATN